jgi:ubiquinone/menaquinone biosynthesis C-methylase UbiE
MFRHVSPTGFMLKPDPTPVWQQSILASEVLRNVRSAVPLAIEQIDGMLQLIEAAHGAHLRNFLDLGCGDGVLSAAIFGEYPDARGILLDHPAEALDAARQQLQAHDCHAEFVCADFSDPGWQRHVAPDAPFDAVVSGLALHQAPDPRKRVLFREIFDLLAPGGLFIAIEVVASTTRWTGSIWDDFMIDAIFGRALREWPGASRADVARDYFARAENSIAPLEVQCDWLREAGFADVDCFLKVAELAVFGGRRG